MSKEYEQEPQVIAERVAENCMAALFGFLFEMNNRETRRRVVQVMMNCLRDMQRKYPQITHYNVYCDESNNPPALISANKLHVDIVLVVLDERIEFPLELGPNSIAIK